MVHNGIEYGLMQAYAEGLNVLKHANVGLHAQETDAETTPLRDPDHYKYELDVAGDHGAVAPRLRHLCRGCSSLTAQAFERARRTSTSFAGFV